MTTVGEILHPIISSLSTRIIHWVIFQESTLWHLNMSFKNRLCSVAFVVVLLYVLFSKLKAKYTPHVITKYTKDRVQLRLKMVVCECEKIVPENC